MRTKSARVPGSLGPKREAAGDERHLVGGALLDLERGDDSENHGERGKRQEEKAVGMELRGRKGGRPMERCRPPSTRLGQRQGPVDDHQLGIKRPLRSA